MSALWGGVVGLSLVLGAVGAALLKLPARVAAMLTAFGGGVLLAAVALELMPEADRLAGTALTAAGLLAGTLVYVGCDAWLSRDEEMKSTREAMHRAAAGREIDRAEAARGKSIAAALFVDGVPESLALGLTIAEGEVGLALLGGIVIGNVVEAYGAAQPLVAAGYTARYAVGTLGAIGLSLAGATVLGAVVDASDEVIGTAEAVAAGAVLAVVAISIVPHAFAEVSRSVATVTTLGFLTGYLLSV